MLFILFQKGKWEGFLFYGRKLHVRKLFWKNVGEKMNRYFRRNKKEEYLSLIKALQTILSCIYLFFYNLLTTFILGKKEINSLICI